MSNSFPFPPSTFPTLSLGTPASPHHNHNDSNNNGNNNNQQITPPATIPSVLAAIQSIISSPHQDSVRSIRPAEQLLQSWETASGEGFVATGYLISLMNIIDYNNNNNNDATTSSSSTSSSSPVLDIDESTRLLAAILLKNGIAKVFAIPLPSDNHNDNNDHDAIPPTKTNNNNNNNNIPSTIDPNTLQSLHAERSAVRTHLPTLLFTEPHETIALHLQLALSNIALFDFPKVWPSLLHDLSGVSSGIADSSSSRFATKFRRALSRSVVRTIPALTPEQVIRIRAVKALRMCLQSVRCRKLIVGKSSNAAMGIGRGGMLDLRHLGSLIGNAVAERKEVQSRACGIFEALAEGIVGHARLAITGDVSSLGSDYGNDVHSTWQSEATLAIGYIKCMTELVPMMEIDNDAANSSSTDPRIPPVKKLLRHMAQICEAAKLYPTPFPPALQQQQQSQQQQQQSQSQFMQEYAIKMDKLYRATLACCIASIKSQPALFAGQIPHVLPSVVEPIVAYDENALQSMPVKRLVKTTGFIQTVLLCVAYDAKREDHGSGNKNAVLAALMGRRSGGGTGGTGNGGGGTNDNANGQEGGGSGSETQDPEITQAKDTVTALLSSGTCERLVESIVGKFLRLHPDEVEEWDSDPEGRYETDLAEKSLLAADNPRHCGDALLIALLKRETDRVSQSILDLTQRVYQLPQDDANAMLSREACYRALELCHVAMVGGGKRRLNFSEWWHAELQPILQASLGEQSPVAMRALQARAVQVVQVYATSLKGEEFGVAFHSIARLMAGTDLVTALCAARCINQLALMHIKGTEESAQLNLVREHSVLALGNAFALANRAESEECLRVTLACVSGLVEANGLYLEPVLQAIAEQLPPLWERARDSVPIHSCLLSVLTHLIMKMGYSTVEHPQVQSVLFPLLDYCTDISVVNRAETLLEEGLRLWLVTLVSSRLTTMGQSLTNMLPRLEAILRSGLEPHLSLKVLQFNAILLGHQVIEPLAGVLRELLINMTSCVHVEQKDEDDDDMNDDGNSKKEREVGTIRDAIAALVFADSLMQLFPELGYSISSPAISKVISSLPGKAHAAPLLEAAFSAFGRMLWLNASSLDEIFAQDPKPDEKIASIVNTWIGVVSSVSVVVMLSNQARTIMFIDQKGAALALCATVCRSPRVAHVAGNDILQFTRLLLEAESRSNLDLDSLVEAACGTARKVVGDGPLGDAASRTADILKADPLLTVSLKEAFDSAGRAVQQSRP